ncbi:tRNA wybutosine-synthesizing protein 2 homolog [Bombina bombina]|uniref:tRNA wybutosine-synthesizing protein 2 homolog n=1 Tax=Bombina bombina TaxID=8345 RepID=UPI00235AA8B0|nr:tRNA wybutosine-synthesizing protein 2 homolog [Bombina bombina]
MSCDLDIELEDKALGVAAVLTQSTFSQRYREYLEKAGVLDGRYRAQKLPDGTVALPVLKGKLSSSVFEELKGSVAPGSSCSETLILNPVLSKRARVQSPAQKLRGDLIELLEYHDISWKRDLERDLPHSWQRHGDMIVLSEDCFCDPLWNELGHELWTAVASSLSARRLAKQGRVCGDGKRSPTVALLVGDNGWVEHVDNGIRYTFDVTKCMFSAGNISEKQRVASLCCTGEVVVDLYAGIGYFTLPYLIHAKASFVHACEWNPDAVTALRENLKLNGVSDQCQIHEGDNRQIKLQDVADRVNLGLIPTSEPGYPVACRVLKNTGGILHIHHNVDCFHSRHKQLDMERPEEDSGIWRRKSWEAWAESAEKYICTTLSQVHGNLWHTRILRLEQVKSYAPHVDHVVLDLECRPLAKGTMEGTLVSS